MLVRAHTGTGLFPPSGHLPRAVSQGPGAARWALPCRPGLGAFALSAPPGGSLVGGSVESGPLGATLPQAPQHAHPDPLLWPWPPGVAPEHLVTTTQGPSSFACCLRTPRCTLTVPGQTKPLPSPPGGLGVGGRVNSSLPPGGGAQPLQPVGTDPQPGPGLHRVAQRAWPGAAGWGAPEAGAGAARRARGEQRRHTITNGIDCDLLKQLKELGQEQEALLQGLELMARGQGWYQQELQRVRERQCRLGQGRASADLGAEGSPHPLGQLLPKVQEVARCLGELLAAACAGPVPPLPSSGPPGWQQQAIAMLKEQNRLLSKEVTDKSGRTQLEREKSALIKQLFELSLMGWGWGCPRTPLGTSP
ncbi:suppressor APC domain-containing protein 2 [Choloepus didactylus]|uniref:suppressor APC domain-containing protein 2 n=1 Tax=Choloepus didactylus TaxID=27675 RepID=UPI0018A102FE|nr:suppressor APC domain-containing protein 2 [Choloepus didactylus]